MVTVSPLQAVTKATDAIFKTWTALQLIVQHHLGGNAQRVEQLVQATVALITSTSPVCSEDDLVDFLYDQFDRMNTDIEDGSPEQVAHKLIRIRDAAANGDLSVAALAIDGAAAHSMTGALGRSATGGTVAYDDGRDDSASMETGPSHSAPRNAPVVDDDGFTQVTHKRR